MLNTTLTDTADTVGQDIEQTSQLCRNVCAVIVTFNPDISGLQREIAALAPQTGRIVIVDNGSQLAAREWLTAHASKGCFTLLSQRRNIGIAAAQNTGIAWARQQGFSHVLLMDQDSVPRPDMTRLLLKTIIRLQALGEKVAATGPRCIDPRNSNEAYFPQFHNGRFRQFYFRDNPDVSETVTPFLIASGCMIPVDIIEAVGDMDAGLFIDQVDNEWCLRAMAKGYRVFGVRDAVLEHNLGDKTLRFWLGRWRNAPMHSPVRHYYMVRNSIFLLKRPYIPRDCARFFMRQLFCIIGFYPLVAKPRHLHVLMIAKGLVHGLTGRSGPMNAPRKQESARGHGT